VTQNIDEIVPIDEGIRRAARPFGLTHRELDFVDHYLRHGNLTKAARDAGYSDKVANKRAAYILRRPRVATFIKQQLEQRWKLDAMGVDEIQARLAWLARMDPAKIKNEDGSYKEFHEIDEATRFCIRSWKDELKFDADGAPPTAIREVKMTDPMPALRTLAQINQLLAPDVHQLNVFLELDERADAARKRVLELRKSQEEAKVVSNQ
jgi:phage terminase small subunit